MSRTGCGHAEEVFDLLDRFELDIAGDGWTWPKPTHQTAPRGLAASAVRGIGARAAGPTFAVGVTPCP